MGPLGRLALGKVHDINGCLIIGEQLFNGFVHRAKNIRKVQRHRASRAGYQISLAPRAAGEILLQPVGITERGGH